jgi:hypothetical protein
MATGLMGAAAPALEFAVEGGVYRVFTHGVDQPVLRLRGPANASVERAAQNAFGRPLAWRQEAIVTDGEARVALPDTVGYYRVAVTAPTGGRAIPAPALPRNHFVAPVPWKRKSFIFNNLLNHPQAVL